MRFGDPRPDGRAIVYAQIQADPLVARAAALLADATSTQRLLARATMNGESTDPEAWRTMFPALFGPAAPPPGDPARDRSEAILGVSLQVADRGEQARSQFRGAIVEALAEQLLAARTGPVRRERRILFDGVPSEIHPYDVTVEREAAAEAWDCKWGARGVKADVLHQLDDARRNATAEGARLLVGLVVFDARRSCEVRLVRERGPVALEGLKLVTLEGLDRLAGRKPA
ncbi:MAG: hypothetical protein A2V85_07885 [Chloroflexi bacterium RBG_16_72_14]|nr:MAG: hypothetical protein A2V85_07885 [Chloroflexi bacterium RBG_16_72_14]